MGHLEFSSAKTAWATLFCCLLVGAINAQTSLSEPAEDGQWPMVAKDFANTRYSGLSEINTENVKSLTVAWGFCPAVNRGNEAAPLAVGCPRSAATPFPKMPYPVDLANRGEM